LDLGKNIIKDINILEKMDCKELKELSFLGNFISDINVLGKVNFKKLKILYI